MKQFSLFPSPQFKAVFKTAKCSTSRTADLTNNGFCFSFKNKKEKEKQS